MRKIAIILASVLVLALAIDLVSAYFLFFYQKWFATKGIWDGRTQVAVVYSPGSTPSISVLKSLRERIRALRGKDKGPDRGEAPKTDSKQDAEPTIVGTPPKVLYQRDEVLGWSAEPGNFRIVLRQETNADADPKKPRYHDWNVTIRSDGTRATSRHAERCPRRIEVLGDSWMFGWALDDELTMAWHLQSEYRGKYCVRNHGFGGYGHLQVLSKFRDLRPKLGKKDILIVDYAQWLLPRNLPSPSVVASLAKGLSHMAEAPGRPLMYPIASPEGRRIGVGIIPLDCEKVNGYCNRKEPTLEHLFEVTIKIFDEIIEDSPARLIVLLVDMHEDDVIKHLRKRGITIVDGRPPQGIYTWDTVKPYDAHPGPIFNHYWFSKLREEIDRIQ